MHTLIKYLILSYSIIILFPEIPQFGIFWAVVVSVVVGVIFLTNPKWTRTSSTFFKVGVIIMIPLFLSIILNEGFSLKKIQIIKYVFPLLITSLVVNHFKTLKNVTSLNKSLKILSVILMLYLLYSFQQYGFNYLMIFNDTDNILAEKSHVISQLYGAIVILFIGTQIILSKFRKIQLLFLVPLLFTGARSVLLGGIIFTAVMLMPSFPKSKVKLIGILTVIIVTVSFIFLNQIINTIYTSDFLLFNLLVDKSTLIHNRGTIDITTFTSGRDLILDYYVKNWEFKDIFLGNGMPYLSLGSNFVFRLHNDFFEFFFSFGIVALIIMITGVYKMLFWRTIKMQNKPQEKSFLMAVMFYFIIVSFTNSILDYQSTLYIYICIGIFKFSNNRNQIKQL